VKNRDKAKILVGDKVPVITTTAGSKGFVGESVSYLDVGLKVEVEPQIGLDDEVAIKVNLEVSSLAREIRTSGGGLAYQIGTRSATTALRLRDGETQLLAGLISNEDRMNASRVPGLGDLPLLGRLFATQRDDSQRTEVVLSITPRVLKNIRRPDVNMTEFWSGSETALRLRPLTLASAEPAKVSGAASTASGGAAPQPGPVQTAGGTAPVPVGSGAPASVSLSPGAGGPALAIGAPGASSPAEAAGPALAQLALQGPQNAANGATFEVALNINTTIPIRGLPLQLEFDRAKLELVESGEGEFFKQNGAAVSVSRNVDAAQGRASLGVIRNTADGASGAGTILKLKFKAKAAGDASIRIVSATPIVVDRAVTAQTGDALKVLIK
jgi:general secretion pathway protein D